MSGDADAIVADAAEERRRLRAARRRNAEQSSMRDVLVGAAERSSNVTLVVGDGRSHRARVLAMGTDVVVAEPVFPVHPAARTLLLGSAAIRTVIVHGDRAATARSGWDAPADERSIGGPVQEFGMRDILAEHLAERPGITAWIGHEQISGTLISIGLDIATVATEGGGEIAYVRLDSTTEISLSVSSSL